MIKKFWLPLNGDMELVKRYAGTDVEGFYGSCPEISPSGREAAVLKTSKRAEFFELVHEVHRNGMKFNYVYNSIVDLDEIQMVEILEDISAVRPDIVTLASPLPLILAQSMKPKPEFEVSTIAEITNPSQCADWVELGATRFALSTNLSRFPRILAEDFKDYKVKILLNEICNLNCIFRKTHAINQAQDMSFKKYPYSKCQSKMRVNWPEQMLKNSWVLPSQLKNYSDNVEFKIVGRTQPSWRIKQWAALYLSETDPLDIMDILPYGKAANDKRVVAGFEPVEGKHLKLFTHRIDTEFFNHFAVTTDPCYARNCKTCGLCRRVAKEYNY
jgi:collagenase-like PrtC family protease